ncbi:glycosyltransferase [Flavobacterium sp. LBUM151]
MNFKNIFIVIVLYKTSLEDSKTIETLKSIPEESINLMVFDNSPVRQYVESHFQYDKFNINYQHNGSNPGLSYAYNLALSEASSLNIKWLLLLDQDTTITIEYIKEIINLKIEELSGDIVSIMPRVISLIDDKIITPVKMELGGICRPILIPCGIVKKGISGINSGTLLNVHFMNSIKGFSTNYSLDMLDHWYFREIKYKKKYIYLLQSFIKQDLSIYNNFEENISVSRYNQLLNAESLFIEEEGFLSLLVFRIRLFFRSLKQIKYKNNQYCKITLKEVFRLSQKNKKRVIK